jgi:hypothetical protein
MFRFAEQPPHFVCWESTNKRPYFNPCFLESSRVRFDTERFCEFPLPRSKVCVGSKSVRYAQAATYPVNFYTYIEAFVRVDTKSFAKKHHFIAVEGDSAGLPQSEERLLRLNPRRFPAEKSIDFCDVPILWDNKNYTGVLPHT